MDVEVNADAENIETGQVRLTHTSYLLMVSHKDGKSAEVPRLACRTALDKARLLQAMMRHDLQARYRQEREQFVDAFATMDDAQLDALIASASAEGQGVSR
jgi:acyl-CoA hydrolase